MAQTESPISHDALVLPGGNDGVGRGEGEKEEEGEQSAVRTSPASLEGFVWNEEGAGADADAVGEKKHTCPIRLSSTGGIRRHRVL